MIQLHGLTWDHPRGRVWLEAASALWRERGVDVIWESQPLEGFESHPIDELCARYDLIVLDHPHLGDALASGSLQPMELVLGEASPALAEAFVGPSLASYRLEGATWALPIDAATQVSARDSRMAEHEPRTWADVVSLADDVPVALSLAGPHALLSLLSVAAALGAPPVDEPGVPWLAGETVEEALGILHAVHARSDHSSAGLNPIGLLERVGSDHPLAYVPLVYGYVNYARTSRSVPVTFGDAPRATEDGVPGSTIGGTGVAVTARATITDPLREHLAWLVAASTQRHVIPELEGQPAAACAWDDAAVDDAAGGFYSATRATIEASVVRPRHAGFPEAQLAGSAIVRGALDGDIDDSEAAAQLTALARASRTEPQETTR